MAGSGYQSSDLLTRFNRFAGRPASGDSIDDTTKYSWLADAQDELIDEIAIRAPKSLYGAPAALTTADGGLTFAFGTDGNGYPLFPIGQARIYPSLSAIPQGAWIPGIDYLDEGVTIRMPNNTPYTGTLYWYGLTPAQRIASGVQPVLQPPASRLGIAIRAVKNFAMSANRNAALVQAMELKEREWFDPYLTLLRKHFSSGGGMGRLLYPWGVPGGVYGPGWSGAWWS